MRAARVRLPDDGPILLLRLAETRCGNGEFAATNLRRAATLMPRSAGPWLALARRDEAQGKFDAAAGHYAQAAQRQPRRVPAWSGLGRAMLQLHRAQEAVDAFGTALGLRDDAVDWGNLAIALEAMDRTPEALSAAQRAASLAPELAALHANVGHLLYRLGRPREAAAALHRALAFAPRAADVLNKLGCVYCAWGRHDESEARFREALAVDPACAAALVNLGTQLLHLRRTAEGRQCLHDALALPPHEADARGEATRVLAMLEWEETLQPSIAAAVLNESPASLVPVLELTPSARMSLEPGRLAQFARLAQGESALRAIVAGFPRLESVPQAAAERWPAIEAHFASHRGSAPVDVHQTLTWLARRTQSDASETPENLDVVRYERAVRLAAQLNPPDPEHGAAWEAWIRFWHATLTWHRPRLASGLIKISSTWMTARPLVRWTPPEQVAGTLRGLFTEVYPQFSPGPCRAAGAYFAVLELHGFVDGNGRLARFLANRELVAAGFHPMLLSDSMRRRLSNVLEMVRQRGDLQELLALFAEGAAFAVDIATACAMPRPDLASVTTR